MKRALHFNFTRMLPGFIVCLIIMLCIGKGSAYDFEAGGIWYNIISESPAEVEVTSGDIQYEGKITIPSSVEYNSKTYLVSGVGDSAFENCFYLTSIDLPDSLISIGDRAFSVCSTLTAIDLPNSLTSIGKEAFNWCLTLTSIELPDSLTSIGDRAFYDCTSLTSIELPDSLTSIGNEAFARCSSLTEIEVSENNEFYSSLDGVLYNKDYTTLISCPCGKESVSLPNSLTSIGVLAFSYCEFLKSIVLPDSLTSIGNEAFSHCSSLTAIEVSENNNLYSSLDGILYNKDYTTLILCPGGKVSVSLPDSLTEIGESAFFFCESLKSVDFPECLTSIGYYAFGFCRSLTSLDFPNSLSSIGKYAFLGCSSLISIDLPDSLTSIGEWAFFDCHSLTSVTCRQLKVPQNQGAFEEISPDAVLYVYENVLVDYKNSNWAQYFSKILPMGIDIPVNSISISPNLTQEIKVGQEVEFTATVLPENASFGKVTWNVSNSEVLSLQISETNPNVAVVTGISDGESTLTATSVDGTDLTESVNIIISDIGTGISGIEADAEGRYAVYTMTGILVKVLNDISELSQLEKGTYIINGTKTIIK